MAFYENVDDICDWFCNEGAQIRKYYWHAEEYFQTIAHTKVFKLPANFPMFTIWHTILSVINRLYYVGKFTPLPLTGTKHRHWRFFPEYWDTTIHWACMEIIYCIRTWLSSNWSSCQSWWYRNKLYTRSSDQSQSRICVALFSFGTLFPKVGIGPVLA